MHTSNSKRQHRHATIQPFTHRHPAQEASEQQRRGRTTQIIIATGTGRHLGRATATYASPAATRTEFGRGGGPRRMSQTFTHARVATDAAKAAEEEEDDASGSSI
jgi:hypothetical protein